MTKTDNKLSGVEKKIGVKFKNRDILQEALTHRSFLNENPNWRLPHNERLEYLGDAVLELVVTEHIFRKYPKHQEGELTSIRAALVNHVMLSKVAKILKIEENIFLSKGEAKDTSRARDAILANAMESIMGAIYLDRGYETVKKFVVKNVLSHLDEVVENKLFIDSKSLLQEIIQERQKITPTYNILREKGPDHSKEFTAGVFFGDKLVTEGRGHSKQEAEQDAASNALKTIKRGAGKK